VSGPERFDHALTRADPDDDWPADDTTAQSPATFMVGEPLTDEELGFLRSGGNSPDTEDLEVGDPLGVFAPRRIVPIEDEPSPLAMRYLYPTERFYAEWRRHWSEPMAAIAVSGLASGRAVHPIDPDLLRLPPEILGVATSTALTAGLVTIAVLTGWRALAWYVWRVVLTNTRIMIVRGILWRRMTTIPLERQTVVRSSRSILGMLLGYGTVSVTGGRWRTFRIRHLPGPDFIVLRITEQIYDPETVEARRVGAYDE
jgi:hypothetical protein